MATMNDTNSSTFNLTSDYGDYGSFKVPEELTIYSWIASFGIFPVAGALGLFLNSLAIYVLQSQQKKSSTEVLLIGLSIADLLSAVAFLLVFIPDTMSYCSTIIDKEAVPEFLISEVSVTMAVFPLNLSKSFTALIGIERTIAIIMPIKFRLVRNKFWIAIIALAVSTVLTGFVTAMILIIPISFTQFWMFTFIYLNAIYITVITCTFLSFCGLQKHISKRPQRKADDKSFSKEKRATMIILGMLVLFIGCNIISIVNFTIDLTNPNFDYSLQCTGSGIEMQLLIPIGLMMEFIYSVPNTIFMILAKDKYKEKWISIFRCKSTQNSAT